MICKVFDGKARLGNDWEHLESGVSLCNNESIKLQSSFYCYLFCSTSMSKVLFSGTVLCKGHRRP